LPLKNLEIDTIPNTDDICLSLYIINTLCVRLPSCRTVKLKHAVMQQ
jgi:hypothetical protein